MKIILKDNFDRDLFTEEVLAENVNEQIGVELVKLYNDKYWNDNSNTFLSLEEDSYVPYDGYKNL